MVQRKQFLVKEVVIEIPGWDFRYERDCYGS